MISFFIRIIFFMLKMPQNFFFNYQFLLYLCKIEILTYLTIIFFAKS
jgi:hypothetical protein